MSFWNARGAPNCWDHGVGKEEAQWTRRRVVIDDGHVAHDRNGSLARLENSGKGAAKTDKSSTHDRSYLVNNRLVQSGVVKVGPWGELKPQNLRDIEGTPTQLIKIIIRYSGCIESIKFQYVADGVAKWSSTWGSESGCTAVIDLGTNHYLTAISGYHGIFHGNNGNYYGDTVIRSLTFESTMGTHGPYGPQEGTAFSLPVKAGKVVAFFGRAGQWLDALGFYLKPTSV